MAKNARQTYLVAAAALVAGTVAGSVVSRRVRARAVQARQPADVAFMRSLHAALRRDLSRLQAVAPQLDRPAPAPVLAGWDTFRSQLHNHHAAEDDDLWPVLRRRLTEPADLAAVDAMVQEHKQIPAALDAVDTALRGVGDVTATVEHLNTVVRDHLDHEEREVLPLVEQHLTRAQWRKFLVTERGRRTLRERPRFLTWVLDDASEQDAAAVLTELPPPARVVYRRVLRPRYEAENRWQLTGAGA